MDDLPPADVRHPVTPNLEIAQILAEGEAFDDAADFGVYFLGCAKRRGTVDLGVHARISTYHSLHYIFPHFVMVITVLWAELWFVVGAL